jgi:hypothetical protein
MTKSEFSKQIVSKRLELIEKVLVQKSKEYAPDIDNAFHNFEVAEGLSFHSCREKAAWEMMVKHLVSIMDLLDMCEIRNFTPNVDRALISEKFGDAINYLVLLEGMVSETYSLSELDKLKFSIKLSEIKITDHKE